MACNLQHIRGVIKSLSVDAGLSRFPGERRKSPKKGEEDMMTRMQPVTQNNGGRLVTADGRTLPLRGVTVRAEAKGGVARVVLTQRFANVYSEPLHVTYLMPLPADGAVSGYAFAIGNRRIVGEVDKKAVARERFEQALAEGRSAGIVDQERSSLFTQELGNIPAGAEVLAELTVDQRLAWLSEGAWEWRFPTAAGPRYQGATGRVKDAQKIEVAVADAPLPLRLSLELAIGDALPEGARPDSPSHPLMSRRELGRHHVELAAEEGARLDRDVVVRWPATAPKVGLGVSLGRPPEGRSISDAAYALITLVPPARGSVLARRRDLILLLDTSGSMGGAPLDQCKKVCAALIDSLGEEDRLEMIEFSTDARRWKHGAVAAGPKQKKEAQKWLAKLQAGGSTEMVAAMMEALRPLDAEAQRQVVMLTDGYIGFEQEVIREICDKLPHGSRLHVVGVGSAVNRSLTAPSARAGRGIEVVIGIDEDPERAARRLVARTAAPLVTDVVLEGDALLQATPVGDLYAGCPSLAAAKIAAKGGTLLVRGRTAEGEWSERVRVPACAPGQGMQAAAALFARETVEELEVRHAANKDNYNAAIEKLGLDFQISTRLTTWVAISSQIDVDPSSPTRKEIIPQELPHGVSAEGVGLRAAAPVVAAPALGMPAASMPAPMGAPAPMKAMSLVPRGAMGRAKKAMDIDESYDDLFADKEMAAEKQRAPEAKAPAARKLKARVRLAKDGRIVLEIAVDGPLDWTPPAEVLVELADGSTTMATVVTDQTTRAGQLGAGQSARLVLELAAEPVRVSFGDLELEIE
jgi:Ca-activated chloride channel family protein